MRLTVKVAPDARVIKTIPVLISYWNVCRIAAGRAGISSKNGPGQPTVKKIKRFVTPNWFDPHGTVFL
jgi:hypothetical protein